MVHLTRERSRLTPSSVVRAGALALALLAVAPASAGAASVFVDSEGVDDGTVTFIRFAAAPGEVNRLTVTAITQAPRFVFRQVGARLTTSDTPACAVGPGPGAVTCTGGGYNPGGPRINLGDRNDTALLAGLIRPPEPGARPGPDYFQVSAGPGNDVVTLRRAATAYEGLAGNAGSDRLTGGAYADRLVGGPGNDILRGGGGVDMASFADHALAVTVNLNRAGPHGSRGESDQLYAIESVIGGRGADRLSGNVAPNTLDGGLGNDTIDVAGGGRDTVNCRSGVDTVRADPTDRLVACERVTRVG